MEVSGQDRAPAALTPRKDPGVQWLGYGGEENRSERFGNKKSLAPTEIGE